MFSVHLVIVCVLRGSLLFIVLDFVEKNYSDARVVRVLYFHGNTRQHDLPVICACYVKRLTMD